MAVRTSQGDFTKGAGLKADDIALVVGAIEQGAPIDARLRDSKIGQEGRDELDEISKLVAASGYGADQILIDPSVVRGLEYYTGPVYEVELTLETKDEKGRPVRFGSVGGGGRYDGLVSRFRGEPVPATGFLHRRVAAAGGADVARQARHAAGLRACRRHRVRPRPRRRLPEDGRAACATPTSAPSFISAIPRTWATSSNMPTAATRPASIIQGSDEKARGEIQIKDLIEGAKAAAAIASNQEWRETRPAQFSCAEGDIVAKVREVLARHDVKWG